MKRHLLIIALVIFAILVGSGCRNIKTVEANLGGLEIQYYPTLPQQEEPSIFDWGQSEQRVVPANFKGPLLLPMNTKYYE